MEQTPKVSIIIPVYNVAPYLRQCMDSVVNQTYRNIEIICVDDGSTDESSEIIDEYAAADERLCVIHQENRGLSAARNAGFLLSTGEYVMYLDSDDWIDPGTCETAIASAEKYGTDLVFWPYVREFSDRSLPKIIFQNRKFFDEAECCELQRHMIGLSGKELAHPENADALSTVWGKLYRREIIEQNDICFAELSRIGTYEDGLFNFCYLAYAKSAIYIPDYMNHYRKSTGMTSKYRSKLALQWKNLFSDMRRYIENGKYGSDFEQALSNRISLSIIGLGLNALALPNKKALAEIRNILSDKEYRAAVKTLPMRYFPLHWWVFFACCKLDFSIGVFLLLKCMERIKG